LPFEERLEFVEKHLEDIQDSAEKPLEVRYLIEILISRDNDGGSRQILRGNVWQRVLN
jgi:hypothetical protein